MTQKILRAAVIATAMAMMIGPTGGLSAAELTEAEKAPAPPPLPEGDVPDAVPEVRIVRTPRGTVSEYRLGGKLYMVRVEPRIGKPYYLLDTDGDGRMDSRRAVTDNPTPPQWVLFSWN